MEDVSLETCLFSDMSKSAASICKIVKKVYNLLTLDNDKKTFDVLSLLYVQEMEEKNFNQ